MKLCDFSLLSSELIQFACEDLSSDWQVGAEVTVLANGDAYLLRQGNSSCFAKVVGSQDRTALSVQHGLSLWVLRIRREKILHLQALDLVEQVQLGMAISVDEAIAEQLANRGEIAAAEIPAAVVWLSDQFIATDNASGEKMARVFLANFENVSKEEFVLFGANWRGTVKRNAGALKLMKLTRSKDANARVAMAMGNISFQDAGVSVRLQSEAQRALLDAALRDNGSYLRLWQEYGALEWEHARDCASKLGSIRFTKAELIEGELWAWLLKVDIEQLKGFRKRWKTMGLANTTQVELGEKELNLDRDFEDEQKISGRTGQRPVRGTLGFDHEGIILTLPQDRRSEQPPAQGFIYYSLAGDEAVQDRRMRARQAINDGRRLPQLSYLLEGVAPPSARRRRLPGLSTYAKACFKGPPTERQKLALAVAINTPDIALIVGPPGTGKTQVIAALQRRLAETLSENSLQHQVLVSSYQHDAVDNALNRAEVFGLPAVRIGGRGRRNEGGIDPVGVWCERKREEIAERIQAMQSEEPQTQALVELHRRITTLRLASLSQKERRTLFEEIDALLHQLFDLGLALPAEMKDRWKDFLTQQHRAPRPRQVEESAGFVRLLRALRTNAIGFADDGSDRVYQLERALRRAKFSLEESDWDLLQRLSTQNDASASELSALAAFKQSMLDSLIPDYRPPRIKQTLGDDGLELLADIEHAIDAPLRQSQRGISAVVAAYHTALAHAPNEAARAVREYASIVGATCQQSAGKAMSSLKELSDLEASEGIEFDTVIIDEAARANPLDLFVPMAMARRRIILVGDHRQLPHLVQRELEDELVSRQSLTEAQAKAYEQSLFERLVKQLKEQEKLDNIKRVVMLDTQYRMHPKLGDFISKQFYESEGLGVLHSGRPAQDFKHTIPGYQGKCAAWLDVPLRDGKEKYLDPGYERLGEANAIVKEIKRIADLCGPTLSIGVISFYRAQCNLILEQLVRHGMAEREGDEIQIARDYRQTETGEERLRIGTVDAFQGKEFDIVFLSIVRANDVVLADQKEDDARERLLNGKYGHLRLANRMNVAMSRQRKLLIAVGDKHMAEGKEAEAGVPALCAFLKLCNEEMAHGR